MSAAFLRPAFSMVELSSLSSRVGNEETKIKLLVEY